MISLRCCFWLTFLFKLAAGLDEACSLNGSILEGTCVCEPAWTGSTCSKLNFKPALPESGYRHLSGNANHSSWGGGGWYDEQDKLWYMWVSEIAGGCGMAAWTSNSQTVRASSSDPLGLYIRESVQFPVWTHESIVTRGPEGEYVAFMSYNVPQTRPICTDCVGGSTSPNCTEPSASLVSDWDPTYMSWAPAGKVRDPTAWSTPVEILNKTPQMDTNFAAVIRPDGSLVGMWRDHQLTPGQKGKSTIHLATATDWKNASTYVATVDDVLFGDNGVVNPGGVEDPFLYVDVHGGYHALFHMLYPAHPYSSGGHAFSLDGHNWTWTGQAYDGNVTFQDGTQTEFQNGDRPHLLFDKTGRTPIALTTAAGTTWGAPGMDSDQTFTLLRPLHMAT